jgi:shikimate kinase
MSHEPSAVSAAPAERPLLLLWGFMAAGKSTVGRLVAAEAKVEFVDLDERIEQQANTSVAAIFAIDGETGFRQLEAAALRDELSRPGRRVIALGGGALLDDQLRKEAMRTSYVLTLEVDLASVLLRTAGNASRPLLTGPDGPQAVKGLLRARTSAYQSVHATVQATSEPAEHAACHVLNMWRGWQR